MHTVDQIEEVFKRSLQREVCIMLNRKVLKQGRLTLFTLKGFCLTFKIQIPDSKKTAIVELPFPFKIHESRELIILSYKPVDFGIQAERIPALPRDEDRRASKLFNNDVLFILK